MTPDALAALHASCFTVPRPWTAAEFAALLADPLAFLLPHPTGFLLGRVVAGEAELLTLAVAPKARRQGIASQLVRDFLSESRRRGGDCAFLEVAADNLAAISLYQAAGFEAAGRRRNYYATGLDAMVLRRNLQGQDI